MDTKQRLSRTEIRIHILESRQTDMEIALKQLKGKLDELCSLLDGNKLIVIKDSQVSITQMIPDMIIDDNDINGMNCTPGDIECDCIDCMPLCHTGRAG